MKAILIVCTNFICGWKRYFDEEEKIPNFCPRCGAPVEEKDE